jgi:pyrroloquinoline quinone (PQQ) biosynthesis protein C
MENNTQITVADLDSVKNIINLASTRGAFRGEELSQVGTVYDKLSAFLEAVIEQAKAQEATNAEAGETQGE